jgi:nitrous oxidase accessory protein
MSQCNKMIVISVILLMALGSSMVLLGNSVYNKDLNTYYNTIQLAIDAARAGDTIEVGNGTYNEQLLINVSITLEGSSYFSTRIEDDTTPGVVRITADNVVIKNIGILWAGTYSAFYYGVKIESDDCTLENVLVADARRNIYIYGGSGNTIKNSIIATVWQNHEGITISGTDNTVCGNTIISSSDTIGYGVVLVGSGTTGNEIVGNEIRNFQYGIYVFSANNNDIYYNNFLNNDTHAFTFLTSPNYNNWDDGGTFGGNFWGGAACADSDGDGMGDSPYIIGTGESDNYPLCCPSTRKCQ